MDLKTALLDIRRRRGVLTAEVVVDESRAEDAPLHTHFEWDDAEAGERYRQQQARELIRSVKIRYVEPSGTQAETRGFVSVARADLPAREYVPIEEVAADPVLAKIALRDAEREWRTMLARYRHLEGFLELVQRDVAAA